MGGVGPRVAAGAADGPLDDAVGTGGGEPPSGDGAVPVDRPEDRPVADTGPVEPRPEITHGARRRVGAVGDADLAAGGVWSVLERRMVTRGLRGGP